MSKLIGRKVKVSDPQNMVAHLKGDVGVISVVQDYETATYPVVVAFGDGTTEAFYHDELRYLNNKEVLLE